MSPKTTSYRDVKQAIGDQVSLWLLLLLLFFNYFSSEKEESFINDNLGKVNTYSFTLSLTFFYYILIRKGLYFFENFNFLTVCNDKKVWKLWKKKWKISFELFFFERYEVPLMLNFSIHFIYFSTLYLLQSLRFPSALDNCWGFCWGNQVFFPICFSNKIAEAISLLNIQIYHLIFSKQNFFKIL